MRNGAIIEGEGCTAQTPDFSAEVRATIEQNTLCLRALALLTDEWRPFAELRPLCPFYEHPFGLFDALWQAGMADKLIVPLTRHGIGCGGRFKFRLRQ